MVLNSNHVCSPKGAPGRPNQSRTLLERSTRLEKSCEDETTLLKRSRERLRETPRQSPVLMTSQRIRHTGKRALSISFIGFVRERIVRRQYRFIFFSDWLVVRRTTNNFNHAIDRTTHRLSNFLKDSPTPKPAVFLLKKRKNRNRTKIYIWCKCTVHSDEISDSFSNPSTSSRRMSQI